MSLHRFWPDSHCPKTSSRRLICHLASMPPNSRTPFQAISSGSLRPHPVQMLHPRPQATSSQHQSQADPMNQTNLTPALVPTCSKHPSQPVLPQSQPDVLRSSHPAQLTYWPALRFTYRVRSLAHLPVLTLAHPTGPHFGSPTGPHLNAFREVLGGYLRQV